MHLKAKAWTFKGKTKAIGLALRTTLLAADLAK